MINHDNYQLQLGMVSELFEAHGIASYATLLWPYIYQDGTRPADIMKEPDSYLTTHALAMKHVQRHLAVNNGKKAGD